ncbi:MAG TPA: hypothetical protein VMH26_17290 [Burkholderiales bacterium]|nr:hypothetical protein [Burkholderiales bacterium]
MAPLWLKSLPWSTIVSNAPLIVDGAKKLASLVKSKSTAEAMPPAGDAVIGDAQSEIAALRARVRQLEQEQKQAAEALREVAESHGQMAQALESLRKRTRLNLCVAWICLVGVATLLLWITFTR